MVSYIIERVVLFLTIREIAKQASVSPATVSLVLNNKPGVGPQRRKEIQTLLLENGYQIKEPAANAAPRKQICIVKYRANHKNDEFSTIILDTIEEYANRAGYAVNLLNIDEHTYEQRLSNLDYASLSGIIIFASEITDTCLNYTMRLPVPTVYVDIFSNHQSINTVNADQRLIAHLAAKHLYNLGHTRIGYLRCSPSRGYLSQRFHYFQSSLRELGMHLVPEFIFNINLFDDNLDEILRTSFADIADTLNFPTAFFAEGDIFAASCIQVLTSMGFRIPQDISIIGVDNTTIASFTSPPLTSIDVNTSELGHMAFDRLMQLMQDPRRPVMHCYIEPFLMRRDSTGPAHTRSSLPVSK